ncbi:MAG: prepilin-type N-terminal cleavage/methylation domain-containing protein [Micrococcales bacterium]|nr:prepilin-type N-terminal cleavage/methylation domain-containing protein [Micrococcales bacterium]
MKLTSRLSAAAGDDGFTLVEMMVSLVILAIVSSGFAYGLTLAMVTTRDDRARVQASNLAARELEIVRNEFGASKTAPTELAAVSQVTNPHELPGQTAGQPLDLDGRKFTVVRTVEWLPSGTGTSPCDGGSAVTYPSLGVNVRVYWQDSGETRDVESNTVLTPPKGTLASVQSFIAAKVTGADGTGVASLPVDISGPGGAQTRVTAGDGCAVFALSSPGNYTVTLDEPGYVSFDGQATTSKPATVANGSIQVVPFSYDAAATIDLEFAVDGDPPGYGQPDPDASVVLFNAGLPTMGKKVVDSGVATAGGLWPFPDGYSVWAGTCELNDPATSGGARPTPVRPDPGETVQATIVLQPVQATFLDDDDLPVADAEAVAEIQDTTGCRETQFTLGTTDADGVVRGALPYGNWTIRAGGYEVVADMPADGSVTYPLQVPEGVGG